MIRFSRATPTLSVLCRNLIPLSTLPQMKFKHSYSPWRGRRKGITISLSLSHYSRFRRRSILDLFTLFSKGYDFSLFLFLPFPFLICLSSLFKPTCGEYSVKCSESCILHTLIVLTSLFYALYSLFLLFLTY